MYLYQSISTLYYRHSECYYSFYLDLFLSSNAHHLGKTPPALQRVLDLRRRLGHGTDTGNTLTPRRGGGGGGGRKGSRSLRTHV